MVRLLGVLAVPAQITDVRPGRSWDWEVLGVGMAHEVRDHPRGSEIRLGFGGPEPLAGGVALVYGPVAAVVLTRLAAVAARDHAARRGRG